MLQDTNYDTFADAYSAENESSLLNEHYERPAMLGLAGDVRGRRILDAGCGAGPLMKALLERGAEVRGFDSSQAMLELARRKIGDGAELVVADLGLRLPFADSAFDDVVASLVFHYVEDWTGPLSEMRRVLRPGGRLLVSVNHPILFPWNNPGKDYFKATKYSDELTFNGEPATLTYWHRPLHAMTDAFTSAGFQIEVVSEPPYSPDAPADLLPPGLKERDSFLSFIFFVLRAPN